MIMGLIHFLVLTGVVMAVITQQLPSRCTLDAKELHCIYQRTPAFRIPDMSDSAVRLIVIQESSVLGPVACSLFPRRKTVRLSACSRFLRYSSPVTELKIQLPHLQLTPTLFFRFLLLTSAEQWVCAGCALARNSSGPRSTAIARQ